MYTFFFNGEKVILYTPSIFVIKKKRKLVLFIRKYITNFNV